MDTSIHPVETWIDEVTTFLLSHPTEEEIIAFQPSEALNTQFQELLQKNRDGELFRFERADLHDLLNFEHLLRVLKAKAQLKLATDKSRQEDEKRQFLSKFDDAKDRALFKLPVEILNLSVKTLQIIKSMGCASIEDCVSYFLQRGNATITDPGDFILAMDDEVKQKLAEHGYGTFD
jgi:hypothetical protein